jgi:hypothetical protein
LDLSPEAAVSFCAALLGKCTRSCRNGRDDPGGFIKHVELLAGFYAQCLLDMPEPPEKLDSFGEFLELHTAIEFDLIHQGT